MMISGTGRLPTKWFIDKYTKKLAAKDLEATTKYRFEPDFNTGGTLGVNLATIGGGLIAFNYRSIFMDEAARLDMHKKPNRRPLPEAVQRRDHLSKSSSIHAANHVPPFARR